MKSINRTSKEIKLNDNFAAKGMYVSIEAGARIYFTAALSRVLNLSVGLYVHFLNEGSEWNFYVNDDPDGFKITPITSKKGFHVTSTGLCNMILKSMGFSIKHSKQLKVEKTFITHDKCPVFKICGD